MKYCIALGVVVCACGVARAQFEQSGGEGFLPSGQPPQAFGDNESHGGFTFDEEYFLTVSQGGNRYSLQSCAPPNPTLGPNQIYVYRNRSRTGYNNLWKLPPVAGLGVPYSGTAKYEWFDGSRHEDKVTYIAHGHVTDKGGYIIPAGEKVSVWAVMASDNNGNAVFFYLGTDADINAPQGRRYPMYWSWEAPHQKPNVKRFVTSDGTKRD